MFLQENFEGDDGDSGVKPTIIKVEPFDIKTEILSNDESDSNEETDSDEDFVEEQVRVFLYTYLLHY